MAKLKRQVGLYGLNQRWLLAITVFLLGVFVVSTAGFPQCAQPPASMVAWWPLDEQSGATSVYDLAPAPASTVVDKGTPLSGSIGSPGSPSPVPGQVGGALSFSSLSAFVEVPHSPDLSFPQDFSIDAWVKLDFQGGSSATYPIVDKWDPNTQTGFSFYAWSYASAATANLALQVTGNWFSTLGNPGFVPIGSWVHVAVTVKRVSPSNWVEVRFYVNGTLVWLIPPAPMGSAVNGVAMWIGRARISVQDRVGTLSIDELELFNRALTDAEILSVFASGPAGKCKPDLAASKKLVSPLVAGQQASYQIAVSNVGTTPVSGPVVVTDTLGPGLNFVSAIGPGWNCSASGQTVTCIHPGPVPPGGSLPSITLTVQVEADAQEIQNCAKVTRADVEQPPTVEVPHWVYTPIPDGNPYNDEACVIASVEGKKAEICIFKFHDLDGDGKQDPNEPGLPGWPFTVSPAPLPSTPSPVTTGPQGAICFGVEAPGTYTITEVVQPGWTPTTPTTQTVTVTPGQTVNVAFGNKQTEGTADLGDAPDSTNHINKPMTAYTGVLAKFPTVFDPATGLPQGPKHLQPKGLAWLGKDVSLEDEADLLPDADGVTNIDPGANAADRDKYDDGVLLPIAIPFVCGQTQFQYTVTSTAAAKLYVNVWIDFNRDGDWDDPIQKCPLGPAITGSYTEWAVQNELITIPGPGTFTFTTPPFGAANPTKGADMWMRITLTDQPIAPVYGADGSGPATGYLYGETEDYLLRLAYTDICGVKFHDLNGNGKQDPGEPGLSDWVIEVKDLNGNFMGFAVTDANGRYCILVPSPGTYTVAEQPQPGWIPTTPSTVTLTVPSQASVNFGNRREEPVGKCDLRITKVANRTTVGSGQQVTYTITVTNVGSTACSGPTTVTETVPPGLTLVSAGGFGWICLGNTCTYLLPIPAGGSVSVTYTFTVTAPPDTRIENCATVSNAADTNPTNDRACAVITVTEKR
jgi:uncharacterized repeat protein (TIGR01451 family)